MEDTGTDTESSRASHDITVGGVGTDATAALEATAAAAAVFDMKTVSAEASGLALDTPTVIVAESRSTEPGGGAPPLCAEIIRSSVYISPPLL